MRVFKKIRQWKAHRQWRKTGVYIVDLAISKERVKYSTMKTGLNTFSITQSGADYQNSPYPTITIHKGLPQDYLEEAIEHELLHHLVLKYEGWKTTEKLDNIAGTIQQWRSLLSTLNTVP